MSTYYLKTEFTAFCIILLFGLNICCIENSGVTNPEGCPYLIFGSPLLKVDKININKVRVDEVQL